MNNSIPFKRFGTMVDASRNAVMTVETFKKWMDLTSSLGFNTAMLYIEDTYEIEGEPYFGYLRGRYSKDELKEIDRYAEEKGMEFIPCFQTLAHMGKIFRWSEYKPINDTDDILLVDDNRTYELIEKMFKTFKECLRTRTVNIGMDEAHMLGRGNYIDKNGYAERSDILLKHLNKVAEIAKKYGFEVTMWGDMFFRIFGGGYEGKMTAEVPEDVKKSIPDNVYLICWDYDSSTRETAAEHLKSHSALKEGTWFAGGLWCWEIFMPNNYHGMPTTKAAMLGCRDAGAENVFTTLWGDDGGVCSRFATLPSVYITAKSAMGITDDEIIKNSFYKDYGIPFDDFVCLDALSNAKQELFNDPFLGFYDSVVDENHAKEYERKSNITAKYVSDKNFGYIFKTVSLCQKALSIKCDLGLRTRRAYQEKNKKELDAVIKDYGKLIKVLNEFLEAFRKQWLIENKPNGLEVQDIRIGGLITRLEHCKSRLTDYKNGRITSVPELDEKILDEKNFPIYKWSEMTTVGIM